MKFPMKTTNLVSNWNFEYKNQLTSENVKLHLKLKFRVNQSINKLKRNFESNGKIACQIETLHKQKKSIYKQS